MNTLSKMHILDAMDLLLGELDVRIESVPAGRGDQMYQWVQYSGASKINEGGNFWSADEAKIEALWKLGRLHLS